MPVKLHNKDYFTVAERLAVAHAENVPKGIKSVASEFFVLGGNGLCRATITFEDGRSFQGTAEVPINSSSPAEKDAPHECAETSAWGRALAAAGYPGSESGLAGAEEVQRPPRQGRPQSAPPPAARREWPKQDPDHVPAEFVQDTARLTGKPTVRQRYAALAADAGGLGLTAIPQPTDDAPDDYVVEMGKTLRARMLARAAEEAGK
ncbi:MAG TPA: hypothetical protein VNM48_23500 [Chloroflexota bacterium]|nr:hypothetical protein [Chloroflexota bacterium]